MSLYGRTFSDSPTRTNHARLGIGDNSLNELRRRREKIRNSLPSLPDRIYITCDGGGALQKGRRRSNVTCNMELDSSVQLVSMWSSPWEFQYFFSYFLMNFLYKLHLLAKAAGQQASVRRSSFLSFSPHSFFSAHYEVRAIYSHIA